MILLEPLPVFSLVLEENRIRFGAPDWHGLFAESFNREGAVGAEESTTINTKKQGTRYRCLTAEVPGHGRDANYADNRGVS